MSDDQKLQSLEDRIQDAQEKTEPAAANGDSDNVGMRAGSEFVAHVIGGAILGWGIDSLLGSMPIGIVVMVLLGFGTGIYRASKVSSGK